MLTFFCTKCYAQNRAEDKVCRSCGAGLEAEAGDYVDRLIRFSLRHPVPSVPPMAAETLGKIGDKRAVEPLIQVLKSSSDPGLLEAAAEALGRLKDKRAVPALQSVLKTGTVAVRGKAVDALAELGGAKAVKALRSISVNDPSPGIREKALHALQGADAAARQAEGQTGEQVGASANEAQKRGIRITLSMLDETLCEVERWANGQEVRSVLYQEHNALSIRQREAILSEIVRLRTVIEELKETLGLEPTVQDVGSAILGKCAGLWEHIVELQTKYLVRYGEVPANLGEYLDPRTEQLIQGIIGILDVLRQPQENNLPK